MPQRFDRSDLIAIIALIISLIGTFVSVREASILSDQQEAMLAQKAAGVLPYLETDKVFHFDNDTTLEYKLTLVNNGIGPAVVDTFYLTLDGKYFRADSLPFLIRELGDSIPAGGRIRSSNTFSQGILPAGQEDQIIRVNFNASVIPFSRINEFLDRISVNCVYCDVYGQCWEFMKEGWNQPIKHYQSPVQY